MTNLTLNHKRNLLEDLKHELNLQVNYAGNVMHLQPGVPRYQKELSSLFIYPTDAQLDCSKRMSQFTLKFTLTFKRRIKSHLPFAGNIRNSPYSPRFQDNG